MDLLFPHLAMMVSGEAMAKLTKAIAKMQSQGMQMMFLPFLVFFVWFSSVSCFLLLC